jgi:hypothetical protein
LALAPNIIVVMQVVPRSMPWVNLHISVTNVANREI